MERIENSGILRVKRRIGTHSLNLFTLPPPHPAAATRKLTRPSKAEKELFVEQILLNDLRMDTFELRNTKYVKSV